MKCTQCDGLCRTEEGIFTVQLLNTVMESVLSEDYKRKIFEVLENVLNNVCPACRGEGEIPDGPVILTEDRYPSSADMDEYCMVYAWNEKAGYWHQLNGFTFNHQLAFSEEDRKRIDENYWKWIPKPKDAADRIKLGTGLYDGAKVLADGAEAYRLAQAAVRWWESHRSTGMSLDVHMEKPTLNLANSIDDRLGHAVVRYLKATDNRVKEPK
jgi:hypothetical protein